jgi:hypothetical protein
VREGQELTTDDPELDGLDPVKLKLLKQAYKKRDEAMEKAWQIGREAEIVTRAELKRSEQRTVRKAQLLERIANQVQSIQELVRDIPSVP